MKLPLANTYLAVLSIRHPNISTSAAATFFHISAIVAPAPAAASATNTTGTAAAVTAATVALYNPLVNPRILCGVVLPRLAASSYTGGSSKLLADFAAVVSANAALAGPNWVQSSVVTSTPLTINATVSILWASCWAARHSWMLVHNMPKVWHIYAAVGMHSKPCYDLKLRQKAW